MNRSVKALLQLAEQLDIRSESHRKLESYHSIKANYAGAIAAAAASEAYRLAAKDAKQAAAEEMQRNANPSSHLTDGLGYAHTAPQA